MFHSKHYQSSKLTFLITIASVIILIALFSISWINTDAQASPDTEDMQQDAPPALQPSDYDRIMNFSGIDFYVKSGMNRGPRANNWSNDEESVWVDDDGNLHLTMRQIDDIWYSSEIISVLPVQYGDFRFHVETPLHDLDPTVILGMFLYYDDLHELDIEAARWQNTGANANNASYANQPADLPNHVHAFRLDWAGATVHSMNWQADQVLFQTFQVSDSGTETLINDWTYQGFDIPAEDDMLRLHINLWQLAPPASEVEIVISEVEAPMSDEAIVTPTETVDIVSTPSQPTEVPNISTECNLQLSPVYTAIINAQLALDQNDNETALRAIAIARDQLETIEAQCGETTSQNASSVEEPIIFFDVNGQFVSGTVSPAFCDPDQYKILLYAGVANIEWYIQPTIAQPTITINSDCTFQSMTHSWDRLAVFLVDIDFNVDDLLIVFEASCPPMQIAQRQGVHAAICYE